LIQEEISREIKKEQDKVEEKMFAQIKIGFIEVEYDI
jgi:hypothetical protein